MNYYFLLEDEKSFMKVLPKWFEIMIFVCNHCFESWLLGAKGLYPQGKVDTEKYDILKVGLLIYQQRIIFAACLIELRIQNIYNHLLNLLILF